MPDYISRRIFKKKALERWENEGGSIFADRSRIIKSGSPDKRGDKGFYPPASSEPYGSDAAHRAGGVAKTEKNQ